MMLYPPGVIPTVANRPKVSGTPSVRTAASVGGVTPTHDEVSFGAWRKTREEKVLKDFGDGGFGWSGGMIRNFTQHGVSLDLADADGNTLLMQAIRKGYVNTTAGLIELSANLDLQNNQGTTALMLAAASDNEGWYDTVATMESILDRRPDLSLRDRAGENPLFYVARHCNKESLALQKLKLLADYGLNINEANRAGSTPLMVAVHKGRLALVKAMMAMGADPDVRNGQGMSARDYAENIPRNSLKQELLEVLSSSGKAPQVAEKLEAQAPEAVQPQEPSVPVTSLETRKLALLQQYLGLDQARRDQFFNQLVKKADKEPALLDWLQQAMAEVNRLL